MFVSSTGGLTAGRVEAQQCIFPYETDDRLHHLSGRVGPVTVLSVRTPEATIRWEPFTRRRSRHSPQPPEESPRQRRGLRRAASPTRTHDAVPLGAVGSIRLGSNRVVDQPSRSRAADGRDPRRLARRDAVGRRCAVRAADEQSRERLPTQRDHRVRSRRLHPRGADRRCSRTRRGASSDHRVVDGSGRAIDKRRSARRRCGSRRPTVRRVLTADRPTRFVPGQRHRRDRSGGDPAMARRRRRGSESRRHRSAHP